MRDPYDRSTKWLIVHQGAVLLHLRGATDFTFCRPPFARFTRVPDEVRAELQWITTLDRLMDLSGWAVECPNINAFRSRLQ